MHDPYNLTLARYRAPHAVDHSDRAAAHHKEANDMPMTAVDITGELSRTDAANVCDVSIDTIKRRIRAGAFPNAHQVGLDRSWVIPVRDLVDAGLLSASALTLPSATESAARAAVESPRQGITPTPATAQLAEALAETRGLRIALARAEDEIAFLRDIVLGRRVA
jgi:hypothetical protein